VHADRERAVADRAKLDDEVREAGEELARRAGEEEASRRTVAELRAAVESADRLTRESRDQLRRLEIDREGANRELTEVDQRVAVLESERVSLADAAESIVREVSTADEAMELAQAEVERACSLRHRHRVGSPQAKAMALIAEQVAVRCIPPRLAVLRVIEQPDGEGATRGVLTVDVPGVVEGWHQLLTRFGTISLAKALAPAIAFARDGFPVAELMANEWRDNVKQLAGDPATAATFLPGGKPMQQGDVFSNPRLARTLELIAKDGRDAFYKGPIARAIVADIKSRDGNGQVAQATAILRVATTGGTAPAQGCDEAKNGQETRVPYTATYLFLK
jgi:hypothetical protein